MEYSYQCFVSGEKKSAVLKVIPQNSKAICPFPVYGQVPYGPLHYMLSLNSYIP